MRPECKVKTSQPFTSTWSTRYSPMAIREIVFNTATELNTYDSEVITTHIRNKFRIPVTQEEVSNIINTEICLLEAELLYSQYYH